MRRLGKYKMYTNGRIIIFFYVDDIVVLSREEDRDEADSLIHKLSQKYELRAMGDLEWFLNIRITRDREHGITYMTQDAYIGKLLQTFAVTPGPRVQTPLEHDTSAYTLNPDTATPEEVHRYQRKIGSLIYAATMTRPDIAFAAGLLARFMTNPSRFHEGAVDRLLHYLQDTKDLSLCFRATGPSGSSVKTWKVQVMLRLVTILPPAGAQKDTCSNSSVVLLTGRLSARLPSRRPPLKLSNDLQCDN
ncbi:hypothetical protein VTN31DRAFT_4773 [Thermomyces dupontii]|uniref:uncharacterized protein n=1 Tax=Talaromyces thermophilus TaxID=28565 RepID=UPI0037443A68